MALKDYWVRLRMVFALDIKKPFLQVKRERFFND